jgi:hypothetical protein
VESFRSRVKGQQAFVGFLLPPAVVRSGGVLAKRACAVVCKRPQNLLPLQNFLPATKLSTGVTLNSE